MAIGKIYMVCSRSCRLNPRIAFLLRRQQYCIAFAVMRSLTVILLFAIATACRTNETPEQQVKDAEITANVKSKLAAELGASTVTNISVNVTNGVVTLAGTVHDSAEKSRAVAIAQAVPGVARVNDNLQIPAAPGAKP
jgi:hypothetical protein